MCGRTDGRRTDGRRTVHSHKEIKNLLINGYMGCKPKLTSPNLIPSQILYEFR
jgi:hypothetical protein